MRDKHIEVMRYDDDPSRNPSATTILVAICALAAAVTFGFWMAVLR